jgi:predicted dehydrogenase
MTLKVGVIGFGYWGPNIVRNLQHVDGVKVHTVCDIDREALKRVKAIYPHVRVCRNYKEVTDSKEIDAVAVVTPASTHFEMAKRAVENGKDVFVEKPLATSVEDAETLLALAGKRRSKIMVDHTFVFTGAVRRIKELVDTNALGELYYYDSTRVSLGLFQHDVNVIWDLASHDFAVIDYLIKAKPLALSAQGLNHIGGQENIAYITVHFGGKLIAHINANWLSPVKIRTTLIGGQKKMLLWDDVQADEKLKVYDKGVEIKTQEGRHSVLVDYRTGDMEAPRLDRTEALKVELAHFTDCVLHDKTPTSDGEAGLRVVKMLVAADMSLKKEGRWVKV